MDIVIQKQQTIKLEEIVILAVRDLFEEKKIIARLKGLPRPVILWSGDEDYAAAGVWTNETALERAKKVLALPEVPFE